MSIFAAAEDDPGHAERRADWINLLPELTTAELQQLHRQIKVRLWRGRFLMLRRLPAPVKLGLTYSCLAFLVIVVIPLPDDKPLFVPLLIAAAGCTAVTLVAVIDLVLRLVLVRLRPQVPAFDSFEFAIEPIDPA